MTTSLRIENRWDFSGLAFLVQDLDASGNVTVGGTLALTGTLATTGALTPTGGIAAAGGFTQSPRLVHTGGVAPTQTTDGTDSTPSVTETYFAEIRVAGNVSTTGAANFNGSNATDKIMCILWDSTGAVVANTATAGTQMVGTDAYQLVPWVGGPIDIKGPATYFLGVQFNGTTSRYQAHPLGSWGANKKTSTTFGTAPSITAPTAFVGTSPMLSLY